MHLMRQECKSRLYARLGKGVVQLLMGLSENERWSWDKKQLDLLRLRTRVSQRDTSSRLLLCCLAP